MHDLHERVGPSGSPQPNGTTAEINVVGEVEPGAWGEGCSPLLLALNHPLEVGWYWADTVLEFSEMRLEENDLMLERRLQALSANLYGEDKK